MTSKPQSPVSSFLTLHGSAKKLLSIAIAFVAPIALSVPVQGQEASDKPPAGFNRPLPPAGGISAMRMQVESTWALAF